MADEKKPVDVVLVGSPNGSVNKVRINGTEFEVSGASPIMQGGQIGVSLTLLGVTLSGEQAQQVPPAPTAPLSPGQ